MDFEWNDFRGPKDFLWNILQVSKESCKRELLKNIFSETKRGPKEYFKEYLLKATWQTWVA